MNPELVRTIHIISDETIEAGIAAGKLIREGSVVRNAVNGQVFKMLPEAATAVVGEAASHTPVMSKYTSDLVRSVPEAVKSNPKRAVIVVMGMTAVGGAAWAIGAISSRRKKHEAEMRYEKLLARDMERAKRAAAQEAAEDIEMDMRMEAMVTRGTDEVPSNEIVAPEVIGIDEFRNGEAGVRAD